MTEDQLKNLADRIGTLRNTRFLDGRLFRIKQLEMIDSTMSEFGIIGQRDMSYFARLNDALFYTNPRARLSGFRTELGVQVSPNYSIISNDNNEWSITNQVFLKLEFFNPLSYSFQSDVSVAVSAGIRNYKTGSLSGSNNIVNTSLTYRFGWYPTTRTSLTCEFTGDHGYLDNKESSYGLGLNLVYEYYITPATRFSVRGGYGYNEYQSLDSPLTPFFNEGDTFALSQGYNFNISLRYAIF